MARKAIYKHATEVDAATYPDDGSSPVGTNEWNEAPANKKMWYALSVTSRLLAVFYGDPQRRRSLDATCRGTIGRAVECSSHGTNAI